MNSSAFGNNGQVRIKVEPEFNYVEDDYYDEDDGEELDYWGMPVKKKKRAPPKERKSRKRKKPKLEEVEDYDDEDDDDEGADEYDAPSQRKRVQ